jgi:hypothetical protein
MLGGVADTYFSGLLVYNQLMKGTKTSQGLRVNQVKYQVIRSVVDESSQCYSVYGKKVRRTLLNRSLHLVK